MSAGCDENAIILRLPINTLPPMVGTMEEYLIRFVAGGLMVSAFAAVGDVVRPKSFAGLFGAAPSIAIVTLVIALFKQGPLDVSIEGRSMILGAIALATYSLVSCQLLKRWQFSGLISTLLSTVVWFAVAFGLYWLVLKGP
jgi:hypothetical protein